MPEIFISYSRENRDKAELLERALGKQRWTVWRDQQIEPGSYFSESIESALIASGCVLALWSKASTRSAWVLKEARFAERKGKLIPVCIEPTPPPFEFAHLQVADLSAWDGNPDDPVLTQLFATIASKLSAPAPTPDSHSQSPAGSPLALLDVTRHTPHLTGAPTLDLLERQLRHSSVVRRFRWVRAGLWLGCALAITGLATIGSLSNNHRPPVMIVMVVLVLVALICVQLAGASGGLDIRFPGSRIERREAGQRYSPRMDTMAIADHPRLVFVTEGVDHTLSSDGTWALTIYFSLFNHQKEPLIVFDAHANLYASQSMAVPPMDVTHRESITIYETNSMLRSGKVILLRPGESESLRLRLNVSRSVGSLGTEVASPNDIYTVFGIFVDLHAQGENIVTDYRFPSDALYCFANSEPSFFFLNQDNAQQWTERNPIPAVKLLPLLRRHTAGVSLLTPHVPNAEAPVTRRVRVTAGRLTLVLGAALFLGFYTAISTALVTSLLNVWIEIAPTSPHVRINRISPGAQDQIARIGNQVRDQTRSCAHDDDLHQFFCRRRYRDPLNRHWNVLTERPDQPVEWLPAATLAELLELRADAGYQHASDAILVYPRPMPGRFPSSRQDSPRWLISAFLAGLLVIFGPAHARGLRALARDVRGLPNDGSGGIVFQLAFFSILGSYFVGPSITPLLLVVGLVALLIVSSLACFRLESRRS